MPPPRLEIRLLGQPDVRASGAPVKLARRATTLTLLALLILRRRQPVARAFLAFTLFPDYEEEQALNELRRYIYLAGKALPPSTAEPWIAADAETVGWNERCDAFVDVVAFEQLAADEATYAQAVELYAGDLLEDVYDDWVVAERERLRSSYLMMLGALIERYRSERDYAQALIFANRLLIADPWREDVVRQIMAIRYASGDATGALATFVRFAKQLSAEMGVTPMPETLSVREAIVLGLPLIGSVDRPSIGAASSRAHALPFVGREHERALLHARWDRAARGFGNSLFIGGEAGVGKTRLAGELALVVETEGGRVFSGGTSSPESTPYQSIMEALRSALSVLTAGPSNGLTINVLSRVFPELQPASDAPDIGVLSADREAARLFSAFAAAVVALAAPRPVLLVLEDLHWASPSTIEAIATICRRLDRARVLVVGTYREEDVSVAHPLRRLLNALGMEGRVTDTHLGRFGRDDVEQLVRGNAGLADAGDALVDRLYALSEGNALFLNEAIADTLERAGAVAPDAEHHAVDRIVASRIGRLSDAAQTVAEIAAVCGNGCNIDVVRDVAGFAAAEILTGFDELLDRRLVREAGARDRYDFVFTHNLIRTSIYERMEPGVRARRHARIAHVIGGREVVGLGDARELARHFDLAGLNDAASAWYLRAAREAEALYAHDDVVTFASRALDLSTDDQWTIEVLLVREEANALLGNRSAQAHDLEILQHLAAETELRCRVLRRVVLLLRANDDRTAERRAVGALRREAAISANPRWLAVALNEDAQYRLSVGKYSDAKALSLRALRILENAGTPRDRLEALSTLIEAEISLGELAEAERLLVVCSDLATASGDRAALCDALMRAVSAATLKQDFARAERGAQEALEHFRFIGDRVGEARAISSVAMACVRLSRWEEARTANLAAAAICEAIGDRRGLARAEMNAGMLQARCGDLHEARRHLVAARSHHGILGDRRGHTASLLNESFVALWEGRAREAKALALDALASAREMDHAAYIATALANLGAAERDLGELDAAIAHMDEGLAMQLALNRMPDAVSDLADAALAYAMRGDLAAARQFADRVMDVETSWTEAAIFPPYPLWIVACVFHWSGDERAPVAYTWARQLALEQAGSIADAALRAHFEALPFYTAMQRVDGTHGWPVLPAAARGTHAGDVHSSRESRTF
jgi:predicted ATPase/DNA-binding SARP family transcriptional activator